MIHGTLMRTMLQHRDLDGVRLAHHGAVEGLAPFALVVALDVGYTIEFAHDICKTAQKRDLAVRAP